jgi:hypothetical protein
VGGRSRAAPAHRARASCRRGAWRRHHLARVPAMGLRRRNGGRAVDIAVAQRVALGGRRAAGGGDGGAARTAPTCS